MDAKVKPWHDGGGRGEDWAAHPHWNTVMTTIFVTGATGLLGAEALLQLAEMRPRPRLLAMVRGTAEEPARATLQTALAIGGDPARAARAMAMIDVVLSDVTRPETLEDRRLDEVTHVLHLAANTSYLDSALIDVINVEGTRALAARCRRMPKLERFLYAGTGFAYGKLPNAVVREVPYQQEVPDSLVRYTKSKAKAEAMLARDFHDLPVIFARPSIVSGHTVLGQQPTTSILWAIQCLDIVNLVANQYENASLDIVPVDWTVSAMLTLLLKPSLKARVFHVSGGLADRSWWPDMAEAFNRIRDGGARPRRWDSYPPDREDMLLERCKACFGWQTAFDKFMYKAFLLYQRFAELNAVFDNSNLLAEGVPRPPPLAKVLHTYLTVPPHQDLRSDFARDRKIEVPEASRMRPIRYWVDNRALDRQET